jgi:hypothetical protein
MPKISSADFNEIFHYVYSTQALLDLIARLKARVAAGDELPTVEELLADENFLTNSHLDLNTLPTLFAQLEFTPEQQFRLIQQLTSSQSLRIEVVGRESFAAICAQLSPEDAAKAFTYATSLAELRIDTAKKAPILRALENIDPHRANARRKVQELLVAIRDSGLGLKSSQDPFWIKVASHKNFPLEALPHLCKIVFARTEEENADRMHDESASAATQSRSSSDRQYTTYRVLYFLRNCVTHGIITLEELPLIRSLIPEESLNTPMFPHEEKFGDGSVKLLMISLMSVLEREQAHQDAVLRGLQESGAIPRVASSGEVTAPNPQQLPDIPEDSEFTHGKQLSRDAETSETKPSSSRMRRARSVSLTSTDLPKLGPRLSEADRTRDFTKLDGPADASRSNTHTS